MSRSLMQKALQVTFISLLLCLGACGQKGPLVPPPTAGNAGP